MVFSNLKQNFKFKLINGSFIDLKFLKSLLRNPRWRIGNSKMAIGNSKMATTNFFDLLVLLGRIGRLQGSVFFFIKFARGFKISSLEEEPKSSSA